MTGLAIVLYLNQTPGQPRERDYAYAGSFYAFAIWIGMGPAGCCDMLRRKHFKVLPVSLTHATCLLIPVQMASQTWDDHDRSNRYTCRDFGANYLMTLPDTGNPIIFCNGDNDTFPLWYNQDTEEVRRDARICNLSYAQNRLVYLSATMSSIQCSRTTDQLGTKSISRGKERICSRSSGVEKNK